MLYFSYQIYGIIDVYELVGIFLVSTYYYLICY